jgi:hypothetical protein
MKKILSLSVLFAALALVVGCGDSKTSSSTTPVKSGGTTMPGPVSSGSGSH